jgi:hypothetical protein
MSMTPIQLMPDSFSLRKMTPEIETSTTLILSIGATRAASPRMTMVRTKVAKSELTFSTPILAKIARSAADAANRTAQNCQERNAGFMKPGTWKTACFCRWDERSRKPAMLLQNR